MGWANVSKANNEGGVISGQEVDSRGARTL